MDIAEPQSLIEKLTQALAHKNRVLNDIVSNTYDNPEVIARDLLKSYIEIGSYGETTIENDEVETAKEALDKGPLEISNFLINRSINLREKHGLHHESSNSLEPSAILNNSTDVANKINDVVTRAKALDTLADTLSSQR